MRKERNCEYGMVNYSVLLDRSRKVCLHCCFDFCGGERSDSRGGMSEVTITG